MTKRTMLGIRADTESVARLDTLATRWPFVGRSSLARAALRLGLDDIERRGLEALQGAPPDIAPVRPEPSGEVTLPEVGPPTAAEAPVPETPSGEVGGKPAKVKAATTKPAPVKVGRKLPGAAPAVWTVVYQTSPREGNGPLVTRMAKFDSPEARAAWLPGARKHPRFHSIVSMDPPEPLA